MTFNKLQKSIKNYHKYSQKIRSKKADGVIGTKVRITKKYAKWLKANAISLHTRPGDNKPEPKDPGYKLSLYLVEKRPVGKIIELRHEDDYTSVRVEFKNDKGKKVIEVLGISEVKEKK